MIKYDLNLQQSALRDAATEGPVYIRVCAVVLRDGKEILAVRVSKNDQISPGFISKYKTEIKKRFL